MSLFVVVRRRQPLKSSRSKLRHLSLSGVLFVINCIAYGPKSPLLFTDVLRQTSVFWKCFPSYSQRLSVSCPISLKNGAAEAEAFRQDGSLGGSCASSSDDPLFDIPSPPPPPLYGACICRGPSLPFGGLRRAVFQRRNDRLRFRAASKSSNSQKFLAEILGGTRLALEQARRGMLRETP